MLWDYNNYVVTLELKLASEIAEKVDDVFLVATEIVVCTQRDGSKNIIIPCHQEPMIQLTRQSNYKHSFTHYKKKLNTGMWGISNLSVTMKIVMIKRTLQVIGEVTVPPLALGNELGSLLTFEMGEKKNRFTDVKISITSTSESSSPVIFFAHKAVLAARSPVFAKMFEHDLQESANNIVTVTDIDPEVFKELLTYIYTGQTPNIRTLAGALLNSAEKYQLGRLKALCERQMSYGLQVENAAETLMLAHTFRANQLKKNALKFIIKHRSEVRETKEWEKVHTTCELLEDLLDTSLELAAKNKN